MKLKYGQFSKRLNNRGGYKAIPHNWYNRWLVKRDPPKRKDVRRVSDRYARDLLSSGTAINPSLWPQWLVELKRATLTVKRAILKLRRQAHE